MEFLAPAVRRSIRGSRPAGWLEGELLAAGGKVNPCRLIGRAVHAGLGAEFTARPEDLN